MLSATQKKNGGLNSFTNLGHRKQSVATSIPKFSRNELSLNRHLEFVIIREQIYALSLYIFVFVCKCCK